jgi:hypothetical protein
MNRGTAGFVCVIAFAGLLGVLAAPAQDGAASRGEKATTSARPAAVPSGSREPAPQDGRFIPRLQWISPHGELPGTYADYLQWHPLTPARFGEQRLATSAGTGERGDRGVTMISILVDSDLYPSIQTAFDQYVSDLTAEGYSVYTETVSGGTPTEIKSWVQGRFDAGCDEILFIGDITAAWAEVSGSVFPCDLFYMDLDGFWDDADSDGDYETHNAGSGDEGPEVYVARVYAHSLSYDTEANMVNDYLAKAHGYRVGTLKQPWRGLEYVDEDWYSMNVFLDLVYGDDVIRHDYGYYTTGADYLNQLDLGQHFVQVCAHSYSGGHHFSTYPTESAAYAHVYVYSPTAQSALMWLGCDDGLKVWLNGDNVYTRDTYNNWFTERLSGDVTLNAGWNRLLCKASQSGGSFLLSARFVDFGLNPIPDLEYQINDPNDYGAEAPFIRSWLLNGFHQDSSDNFWWYLQTNYLGVDEASINPSDGDIMGGQTWTTWDSSGPFVDMGSYCGDADFGVCYAFARIYADASTSCELWLGYDDGARVWLNGSSVLYDNRYGGFEADMQKVGVTLNAGENRLVVKISEWMGTHGFSARFAQPDGSTVPGLTYDPPPQPITYIGTWLINGPYLNPDEATRLSEDYLGGEADVRPSAGDPAPLGSWQRALGSGDPFDIGAPYNHGDWVYSQTVQDRDPPALFYNLFSCGPGRFTDSDYLAGAYIFNTTYGLITVASSKSGSMLNFQHFTGPLGEGKSVGVAFREWFDAQAPFEQWEREWYYGMVLNGDPTLRPVRPGDLDRDGDVDLSDLGIMLAAYGACAGDPNYDPAADIDASGCVDLVDLGALLVNYGYTT